MDSNQIDEHTNPCDELKSERRLDQKSMLKQGWQGVSAHTDIHTLCVTSNRLTWRQCHLVKKKMVHYIICMIEKEARDEGEC